MTPHESRKLRASVRKVRGLIKEYGDCLRTERDAALAEVERLKEELQAVKQSAKESIGAWQITAGEWAAKHHHARAEVERLQAHTWQQERAAIVAWMNNQERFPDAFPRTYSRRIERGEHWPEGGTPNGGP